MGIPEFGEAFETYLFHELVCHRDYVLGEPLSFRRSTSGFEVDFLLSDHTAVEVKAKENVSANDLKPLRALRGEGVLSRYLCVCFEPRRRTVDGILTLPYAEFLDELWTGDLTAG